MKSIDTNKDRTLSMPELGAFASAPSNFATQCAPQPDAATDTVIPTV